VDTNAGTESTFTLTQEPMIPDAADATLLDLRAARTILGTWSRFGPTVTTPSRSRPEIPAGGRLFLRLASVANPLIRRSPCPSTL